MPMLADAHISSLGYLWVKNKQWAIFHSHGNKTHFHKTGCALSLILKVRVFGTRKWPITGLLICRIGDFKA